MYCVYKTSTLEVVLSDLSTLEAAEAEAEALNVLDHFTAEYQAIRQ